MKSIPYLSIKRAMPATALCAGLCPASSLGPTHRSYTLDPTPNTPFPISENDVVGLLNFNYKSRYISKRFRTHTCAFSKKQCLTKHEHKISKWKMRKWEQDFVALKERPMVLFKN